MKASLLYH